MKKKEFFTKTEGDFYFVTIKNSETFNMTEYKNYSKIIVGESEITYKPYSFSNRV